MKLNDISSFFKQAQQIQEKLAEIHHELENEIVTASSGGGMVTVRANGRQELLDLSIEPEVVNADDIEMLSDLIVAAVNQALVKSRELANERLSQVTGGVMAKLPEGLKIPGL